MTAKAAIRQSDLRRVTAAVKESGCTIEVERDGLKIRVIPEGNDAIIKKPKGKAEISL